MDRGSADFRFVGIARNEGVEAPRRFDDYTVVVHESSLPEGVVSLTPVVEAREGVISR